MLFDFKFLFLIEGLFSAGLYLSLSLLVCAMMADGVRVELTEAQKSAARSNMDSEFSFILCNKEVDEDGQLRLVPTGVKTASKFAVTARDETDYVKFLEEELGIKGRLEICGMIDAWEAALKHKTTQSKVDAESKAQGLPWQIWSSTYKNLIKAFQTSHIHIGLVERPAKVLIEAKLEQVDEGSFKPELLSDIVVQSVEDETDTSGNLVPAKDGSWQMRRSRARGSMPADTEEMRSIDSWGLRGSV